MAYSSTVSAPWLIVGRLGAANSTAQTGVTNMGGQIWGYNSTADNLATVVGSSYFSNGYTLGMRKYDQVIFTDVGSTLVSWLTVTSVTSAGADPRGVTVSSLLTS